MRSGKKDLARETILHAREGGRGRDNSETEMKNKAVCVCACKKEMQGRGTEIEQTTRPQRRAVLGQDMKTTIV